MTQIINGKQVANEILSNLAEEIKSSNAKVQLTVIQVGNDAASSVYVRNKERAAESVGIQTNTILLDESVSQNELITVIEELNSSEDVNGILVQLPLPNHIDEKEILHRIDPSKDVDGFHVINMGKLWTGSLSMVPCTPAGIIHLLDNYDIAGKHALIVGRSNIVGKPIAQMMLDKHATVTISHSRTENLDQLLDMADIIIAAVGIPEFITHCKKDAIVIDVGINRDESGKLVGDVKRDLECAAKTVVPGGVGPMTVAMLMKQTYEAYKKQKGLESCNTN